MVETRGAQPRFRIGTAAVGTALLAMNVLGAPASATDRWVATTGSDAANSCTSAITPCATIQHAVDQAAYDDAVKINMGTYTENVIIDPAVGKLSILGGWSCFAGICLRGIDPGLTVIDGDGYSNVLFLHAGSADFDLTIDMLTMKNGAGGRGGGIYLNVVDGHSLSALVTHCIIRDSSATLGGGGVYVGGNSGGSATLILDNNIIFGNTNGGVQASSTAGTTVLEINHCTISDNSRMNGGGIYSYTWDGGTVSMFIYNSIVWGNSASSAADDIYISGGTVNAYYSNIGDVYKLLGIYNTWAGVVSLDPLFVDAAAADYHLQPVSPMVDAAQCGFLALDLSYIRWSPYEDFEWTPRPADPALIECDMGADEIVYLFKDGFASGDTSAWSSTVP